jgi:hypothetical protein
MSRGHTSISDNISSSSKKVSFRVIVIATTAVRGRRLFTSIIIARFHNINTISLLSKCSFIILRSIKRGIMNSLVPGHIYCHWGYNCLVHYIHHNSTHTHTQKRGKKERERIWNKLENTSTIATKAFRREQSKNYLRKGRLDWHTLSDFHGTATIQTDWRWSNLPEG